MDDMMHVASGLIPSAILAFVTKSLQNSIRPCLFTDIDLIIFLNLVGFTLIPDRIARVSVPLGDRIGVSAVFA